jgi:hypothetical protein
MNYMSNIARSKNDPKVLHSGPSSMGAADALSKGLGWFSVGLGMTELLAPGRITSALGLEGKETLVRAAGAREILHGILCLSPEKKLGAQSRVAGDALDIATLLTAYNGDNPKKDNVALALLMVAGISLLDLAAAQGTTSRHRQDRGRRRMYYDRSGFPRGLEATKGAAKDFQAPRNLPGSRPLAQVENQPAA